MLTLLFIVIGLVCCFPVMLIFILVKAGRRADEGEEKILAIMLTDSSSNTVTVLDDSAKLPVAVPRENSAT